MNAQRQSCFPGPQAPCSPGFRLMFRAILRLFRWLTEKVAIAVLIVGFVVAGCGLWLYLREHVDFNLEQWRQDTIRAITGEHGRLEQALADTHAELKALSGQIAGEQQRLAQADKVIAGLDALDSTWDRVFGDRTQQTLNEQRLAKVVAERKAIAAHLDQLRDEFTHKTWTRDGLEIALGKEDAKLRAVEAKRSKVTHYLEQIWNYPLGHGHIRLPLHDWVLLVLGLYFLGPSLGKLVLYFIVAPQVMRGRPVRLADAVPALPHVGDSSVAADLALSPGERLWIKEKFLQASDEGLSRKTRYLLDWKIPFTCVAAGLVELIEMANKPQPAAQLAGVGAAVAVAEEQRLTLSNQADPHSELAVVTLPEGASLVLRPSFLAGVVTAADRPLRIRRRWQLFRWQSWVTLQFRFFEFVGPCRLIIAGSRGVRAENLASRAGAVAPARRTNQDATVGFTPNLDYRPVRAETFWSYYRGMNPLFDDLFAGHGIFLCQQVATEGDAKQARKFWATIWGGVMKVFGL